MTNAWYTMKMNYNNNKQSTTITRNNANNKNIMATIAMLNNTQ